MAPLPVVGTWSGNVSDRAGQTRSMCTALLCAQQRSRTETTSPTTLAEQDLPVASGYPRERRVNGWRSAVVALAVVATGFGASAMLRPAPRLASKAPKAVAPPSGAAPQTSTDELKSPALVPKVESRAAGNARSRSARVQLQLRRCQLWMDVLGSAASSLSTND
jgi:hypothetical protein